MYIMRTKIEWHAAKNTNFPLKIFTLTQGAYLLLQRKANFYCFSPVRLDVKDAQMHVQAFSLRKYTSHVTECSPQDYIISLLYLGCMTSSGQIENSKLYNSVSFRPNKNRFGQFHQTTKRSISTKGIRNCGKFEPSISVAQKWWCLGVSHHRYELAIPVTIYFVKIGLVLSDILASQKCGGGVSLGGA